MWPNPQESADLVTFTEEILNAELHFLCSGSLRYELSFNKDIEDFLNRFWTYFRTIFVSI